MRMAMEAEAVHASQWPFIEYGQDIHIMAALEKGASVERLSRTDYDTLPAYEEKEQVDKYIANQHSRKSDKVPITLYGKGYKGYLLQEWACHRGKGAPQVSQTFKNICLWYGNPKTEKSMLKTKIRKRMDKGGIRYASLGDKYSS